MSQSLGEHLTGDYRVRAIKPFLDDGGRLFRKTREKIEVRRHTLKLRFWPRSKPVDEGGKILDVDWSWIKSLPGMKVGELRLNDTIGGHDNLRVIFFVGPPDIRVPLPMIWALRVMQKKRDDFSKHDLSVIRARRTLVLERFYNNHEFS
jgi:hypothetical protein